MYFQEIVHTLFHGVGKVFTAVLHCNASNLMFEILKHYKIWGAVCISVPTPNYEGPVFLSPVIYAHVWYDTIH